MSRVVIFEGKPITKTGIHFATTPALTLGKSMKSAFTIKTVSYATFFHPSSVRMFVLAISATFEY